MLTDVNTKKMRHVRKKLHASREEGMDDVYVESIDIRSHVCQTDYILTCLGQIILFG